MKGWFEIAANRRAIAYILFSAVMLGVIIAAGIHPTRKQTAETREEINRLQAGIEEQKIFHPLYETLKKKTKNKQEPAEITENEPIGRNRLNIDNAAEILASRANYAGMATTSFSPVPGSMEENSDRLLVYGRLEGDYKDFRKFLISLVTSPACESLELLEAKSGTMYPEYRLRLWLAIE